MKESTSNAERSCSRDGLCDDDAVESGRAGSVRQESCGLGKLGYTCDTSVFLVQFGLNNFVFCGSDGWENVRFALVVTVGTDTSKELSVDVQVGAGRPHIPRLIFSLKLSALKASVIPKSLSETPTWSSHFSRRTQNGLARDLHQQSSDFWGNCGNLHPGTVVSRYSQLNVLG